ncbi:MULTISPECIES: DUF6973 domain-containing protein [Sphingobacterium]|uniref:DUF6973 domain-containing protein n=1 Tax=Sphingobacterium TaxID=28453 RepID=UPI0013D9FB78|nr:MULTISPECIES: hypothetical protein [unclassified Sphingobacterium]
MRSINLILITFSLLFFISCSKNEIIDTFIKTISTQEQTLLREAKTSFNNNYVEYVEKREKLLTNNRKDKIFRTKLTPVWEFSRNISNNSFETPLINSTKKIRIYNFDKKLISKRQEENIFKNSLVRLLSINRSGKYHNIIITYTPSIDYTKSIKNIRINNLKDFSGYIEYATLNEEILFVAKFKNGKLYRKYNIFKKTPNTDPFNREKNTSKLANSMFTSRSSGGDCGWLDIEIPQYATVCLYEGDPAIEICGEHIIGYEYYTVYNPCEPEEPEPDFCDIPENFYICFPEDGGGSGEGGNLPPANNNYAGLSEFEKNNLIQLENTYRQRMTKSELEIFDKMPPYGRLAYLKNALTAETYVNNNFQEGFLYGKADAFRHAYFTAMNSYSLGYETARRLSEAHEDLPQDARDKTMDLYNNSVGLMFVNRQNPGWDPLQYAQTLFDNGQLVYLTPLSANGELTQQTQFRSTNE